MQLTWQDNDAYDAVYLAQTGSILAVATVSEPAGVITWATNWIAADGQSSRPEFIADGNTLTVIQGEQTGAGLFVVSAECNGELLPEIVLMLLGAGYGSNASYSNQTVQAAPPQPEPSLPAPTRLAAPQIVSVSVSSLKRITIKIIGVDWESAPAFQYSFRFMRNAEIMDERRKTPDNGPNGEQTFFDEIPLITFDNAAEWSLVASGCYWVSEDQVFAYGESSIAPLTQESSAVLSEFHFYDHGGISWVFADWQNAAPIAVESRIDGGSWKLAYITDKTVSNAHSILHDMAFYQFYAGFDGQIHTVETRARIDGSADPWRYGETHSLILASEFTPILVWNSHSFTRERGEFSVPLLMLSGRRDEREQISAAFSMDGEPFIPIPYSPKTTETTTTFVELVRYLSASKKDGHYHPLIVKESLIREGIVTDFLFPEHSVFIPERSFLMPAAPSNIVISYRRVTNPFTRLQTGYEVLATGAINVSGLKVSASIDGAAHVEGGFQALSPTMTKITGITIPRDGLNHAVAIKFWVHDSILNEDSDPLLIPAFPAVFDLEPPAAPTDVIATLLRDGSDAIPDQVQLAWDSPNPVDIYVMDSLQAKRKVYSANTNESSVILENNRRFGTQNGTAQSYKFGCAAFNRSVQSEIVYAAPLTITAGEKDVTPPTPDEVAGTAEKLNQAQLVSELATELPSVDSATISSVINALITKIKSVVALGGSVSLNDLGQFAAKWSTDKISSTGLLVPAVRSGLFLESDGFTKGTKLGRVMSDTEAALLK